jgi:hypothetical protein
MRLLRVRMGRSIVRKRLCALAPRAPRNTVLLPRAPRANDEEATTPSGGQDAEGTIPGLPAPPGRANRRLSVRETRISSEKSGIYSGRFRRPFLQKEGMPS